MGKTNLKRLLCLVLSLAMVFALVSFPAFAEETDEAEAETVEEAAEAETVEEAAEAVAEDDAEAEAEDTAEEEEEEAEEEAFAFELFDDGTSTALAEGYGTLTAGDYSLDDDVTLTGQLTISGEVTLDLCGHTITGKKNGTVFSVSGGSSFTLTDSSTDSTGTVDGNGGRAVSISLENYEETSHVYNQETEEYEEVVTEGDTPASFIMQGGKITGCAKSAVYLNGVAAKASFVMRGGEISGNKYENYNYGSAVHMQEEAEFKMTGGIITDNYSDNGGAVYMDGSKAVFTLDGGEISGNTAAMDSAGV